MDERSFENTLKVNNVTIEQLLKFQERMQKKRKRTRSAEEKESVERIKSVERINRRGLSFPFFFLYIEF